MAALKSIFLLFLRFTERYTRTDMRYLASAAWWMGATNVFAGVLGLLLTLVLASVLTKEGFGTYKFVLSLFGIVTAFSLTGINTAVTQAVARGFEGAVRSGYRTGMRWSAPMVGVALLISGYYFLNGNILLGSALLAVAVAAPFIQNGNVFNAFLLGRQDFRTLAVIGGIFAGVPAVVTASTVLVFPDPLAALVSYLASSACTTLGLYYYILARYKPNDREDSATLGYGKHLSLMGILGAVSLQADRVLIFHGLGAAPLAVYALALAIPQQLRVGSKILGAAALPKLSIGDVESIRASLPRKALVVFCVSVFIAGAYMLAADPFFRIFFPEYLEAIPYSRMFALVILFFPATLYQQFLTARMEQKSLYFLQTSVPLVKIALLLVLIPLYGLYGALFSILGMEAFRLLLVVYLVHGRTKQPSGL